MRRKVFLLAAAVLILCLAGACSFLTNAPQPQQDQELTLQPGQRIGQTLKVERDGLTTIGVRISGVETGDENAQVILHLKESPEAADDLARVSLPVKNIQSAGFTLFSFHPIRKTNQTDKYFELEFVGAGKLTLATGAPLSYLDGSVYINQQPAEGQLSFQLTYEPLRMLFGFFLEGLLWLGVILAAGILFFLPGAALLTVLLPPEMEWSGVEKFAISAGVGFAIYPLLFLWSSLVGLSLGEWNAFLPPLAALIFFAWRAWRRKLHFSFSVPQISIHTERFWSMSALVVVMAVVIFTRFWAVRSMDAGLWGDSFQHTEIAQLLVDHGGLFNSWQPYADLTTLTYHFGFHSWIAVFHWLTGIPVLKATLWVGQIVNILAVFTLYPLALKLVKNAWAGVAAVLIAGMLMPMPMFYVNWGRYTQLAGQAILPVAVTLLWGWLLYQPRSMRLMALNALVWGGLALTHYRILILGLLFIPAFFAAYLSRQNWKMQVSKVILLGVSAGILFLPWFIHVYGGKILTLFSRLAQKTPAAGSVSTDFTDVGSLFMYAAPLLWALLIAAVCWGLWQRSRAFLAMVIWWGLLFLSANPGLLGLPGDNIISNLTVVIAIYIPIGICVGAVCAVLFTQLLTKGKDKRGWVLQGGAAILAVALAIAGIAPRLEDVHTNQFVLATRPDLRAFGWISQNTPADSRFLVNSFLAFYDTVTAGSDGGWWLPLLTRRGASIPPMNTGFEQGNSPDYQAQVNQLVSLVRANGVRSDVVLRELAQRGIRYIYIGQVHGRDPGQDLVKPEELQADPHFRVIYHQDRVWIFEIQ